MLFKYFKFYKKECILGPLFKLLEAIFDLLVPVVVALIIDNGIEKNDLSYTTSMSVLLAVFAVLGVIAAITAQYFAAKASVGIGTKLKKDLYQKVNKFSFKDLDEVGESTIINRLTNDTLQIQNGINLILRLVLRSPFIVFGSVIMAFTIDYKMGLIFLLAVPLLFAVIFTITKICVPIYNNIQNKKDNLLSLTKETLSGTRVIRALRIENKIYKEFEDENLEFLAAQNKASKISSCMNSLNYAIINFGIIFILWIGGKEVFNGVLSNGNVVALYNYMSQILIELVKLASLLIMIPKMFTSISRTEDLLSKETNMVNGHKKVDAILSIDFNHVYLNYLDDNEEKAMLKDISFDVKRGETLGIIGGTASGKTSLVNMIPRFYDATSGNIFINGSNIKDYDFVELRNNIGIVMQNKVLFSGTIAENIKFGCENLDIDSLENALEISEAKDFVNAKENNVNEKIEEGGKNLSGGQRQRLTIARAVYKDPSVLILDDSMSALDLATDRNVRRNLSKISKDKIVIIVSQRISTIRNLDKILVIDNGKIVGFGKHDELLNNCDVYKEIYNSQYSQKS